MFFLTKQSQVTTNQEIAMLFAPQPTRNDKENWAMRNKQFCVYILTNSRHTVLYTGVTNNLERRILEHKSKIGSSFTKRYNVDQLVFFKCGDDISVAIAREKQIKAGSRQDKIDLINSMNPEWEDLSEEFWK